MFILMATFQSEWGLRVGREKAKKKKKQKNRKGSSFLAINCVFLIIKKKVPTNWGANIWKGRRAIMTPYEKCQWPQL